MRALRELWTNIDTFMFGRGSPATMGLFRILVGSLAFISLASLLVDFDAWFTERGFVPLATMRQWMPPLDRHYDLFGASHELPIGAGRLNLLGNVTDPRVALVFIGVVLLAAVSTTIGFWTRISSIVLAVGVVTLHNRNPIILHGGDTVLRISVLYVALAPSGAAWSLDRLIALRKGFIIGAPAPVSLWPQRLVQLNMAIIYFTAVWLKWGGNLWREGTATWYPARLQEFSHFPYPAFMRNFPVVYLTTFGTLAAELSLATLVFFKPFRKWVLLAGLIMHGAIEYTMNIPLFSFLMVGLYVSFYSGEEVSDWWIRASRRFKPASTVDGVCKVEPSL